MAEDPSRSIIDLKPAAAFRLGFFARHFDSAVLTEVLRDLRTKISPVVFNKLKLSAGVLMRSPDGSSDWHESLRLAADRTFDLSHPCRSVYDLGAALGNYFMQRLESDGSPVVTPVWDCVRRLPNRLTQEAGCLHELVKELDGNKDLESVMKRAVGPWAKPLRTPEDIEATANYWRILGELSSATPEFCRTQKLAFVFRFVSEVSQELAEFHGSLGDELPQPPAESNDRKAEVTSNTIPAATQWQPGYLGLEFDEGRHFVRRAGFEVVLKPLNWFLLCILSSFGERPASRKVLASAWTKADLDDQKAETKLDDALTDLRKYIKQLGLRTKVFRGLGWTLVPIKTAPAPSVPKAQKTSPQKKRK